MHNVLFFKFTKNLNHVSNHVLTYLFIFDCNPSISIFIFEDVKSKDEKNQKIKKEDGVTDGTEDFSQVQLFLVQCKSLALENTSIDIAKEFLKETNNDLQRAVNLFLTPGHDKNRLVAAAKARAMKNERVFEIEVSKKDTKPLY